MDWGQFIKLAMSGMFMICIEWWSFEVGSFVMGEYSQLFTILHATELSSCTLGSKDGIGGTILNNLF